MSKIKTRKTQNALISKHFSLTADEAEVISQLTVSRAGLPIMHLMHVHGAPGGRGPPEWAQEDTTNDGLS